MTKISSKYVVKKPYIDIHPINNPQITLTIIKILFLEYLSINVPAYKPQNKVENVIIKYAAVNFSGALTILTKYHGIATIVMPCAKPDIIFAANNNLIVSIFFTTTKVIFKVRFSNFER